MKKNRGKPFRGQGRQSPSKQPATAASPAVELLLQRAISHHEAGQLHEAEALYRQVLQTSPGHSIALHLMGVIAFQMGQCALALELIDRAIQSNPDYAEAHNNRGSVLHALQQYPAAVASYDQAILLKPDYAEAYCNRGNSLHALCRYQEALESCDRAIALNPDYAEAHYNRGKALHGLERYQPALESYDHAIRLNPRHAEAYNNRGGSLQALLQYEAALESFNQAILLKPDYADAFCNRGNARMTLKQYPAGLEDFDQATLLNPDREYLHGMRLFLKRVLCQWDDAEDNLRQIEAAIHRGEKAALPFAVLAVSGSPAAQKHAAEIYVRDKHPPCSTAPIPPRPRPDRIRIGYFSADYYNHAISNLIVDTLERHDRSRFEILGFSFGPDKIDEMSKRVSAAMDRFVDVRSMPDGDVVQLSRELEVDIAVDLTGFTKNHRTGIFAGRAAPIQVNYLGYPGTMGAAYIDYLLADPTLIPEASRRHYSEKIVYLPDSYQANSQRPVSAKPCARQDEGLPETAFVYCCFNNTYKITPTVFDTWMRILSRVEGSVLWLLQENPWAVANLQKEAARRGISPQRIVFARRQPAACHLARQQLADLFLDTSPYNAHTTASDALWAGLPVLTRPGETFASRVAASLLRAVGLPELITATEPELEELAVTLAHDAEHYRALRHRLQQNLLRAPLFDSQSFTHSLEAAYIAMFERHHAGLPPDHIQIARS